MEDQRNILKTEKPFSYRKTKDGKAFICFNNKQIKIITGKQFDKLLTEEEKNDDYLIQLLLAKLTGHFKHGNEK